jgi:hypothetical protein
MRTNDLSAGLLIRDAGRFRGRWLRGVAGQSSEGSIFLNEEITRLTCEKAQLCRAIKRIMAEMPNWATSCQRDRDAPNGVKLTYASNPYPSV